MTDRKVTRVYCSRSKGAHEIGAVYGTTQGWELRYSVAVEGPAGFFGASASSPIILDAVETVTMWCSPCKRAHHVVVNALFLAAQKRERSVNVASLGAWDGAWKGTAYE